MNQPIDYFKQAELALAAYSKNLEIGRPAIEKLKNAEFSDYQAHSFTDSYSVIDQFNDSATGLSATVFADKNSGETFLAVRGTEIDDVRDFATGVFDIMLFGSTQLHPQYNSLRTKVTEWLSNGTLSPTFTVTGHSMGGFLAIGLADDPLFINNISHAYLFNAPGLGGFAGPFINTVLDWMGLASTYDQSKISNIIAATGISPIAGLGFDAAPPIDIVIEDQIALDITDPPGARNHSQQVLTDALAVYAAYSQLAPDLELSKLSTLIDAFGSTKDIIGASNSKTLEAALDALRIIILNPADGKVALVENQKTETGNRDQFYANLYELQNSIKFKELAGKVQLTMLSDLSSSDLIAKLESNDQQGLAARFALIALNPFILEGENLDYNIFNENDTLTRFDPASGSGTLTSAYLVDRMTMLIRKNWFNIEDKNPLDSSATFSSSNHSFQNINDYFEDVTSGLKISQGELTASTPRYFFGGENADNPAASAVEDHLYGGNGNDTLKGLEGNDYLEGGYGVDTYIINPGDGTDTVLDIDGLGVIQFGSLIAQGRSGVNNNKDWIKVGESWMDFQNDLVYLLVAQENGSYDLFVSFVGSSNSARVRIKNWSDGKLGITLGGNNTSTDAPVLDRIITGDLKPEDPFDYDELGNIIVGAEEDPDREDFLYGSAENDHILGRGGNDEIDGKDGKDRIEGGSGDDILSGDLGDDIVLGGSGSDIVKGQLHNDRLYADTEYNLDTAYLLSNTQTGNGKRGDLLDGYTGDDTLIGDAGDDILMGGLGNDILIGLGGNDTIESDRNIESADRDWKITRSTDTKDKLTTYYRDYNFGVSPAETAAISGGNDVISSGTGKDWIFAGGGNDFVDAGADDDVIFGDAGNDTIMGKDGNDVIIGDNHPTKIDSSLHGNDYLDGGDGNDYLVGSGGSDYLAGGSGKDVLIGDDKEIPLQFQGDDYLDGGQGDDQLLGGGGNDTLIGGSGNDELYGGAGDDLYIDVEAGDFISDLEGQNTILLAEVNDATAQADFAVKFHTEPQSLIASTNGTSASNRFTNLVWSGETGALQISLSTGGTLDLQNALYGMNAQFQFDHGHSSIDLETWVSENLSQAVVLNLSAFTGSPEQPITKAYGGKGADLIQGGINDDTISGYGGDDYLLSSSGDDKLMGGSGNDALFGQAGNDTLVGGTGADLLTGGSGNDVYVFNRGDGADVITAAIAEDAAEDIVQLGEGINANDLRFFKLADNSLLMRIEGTQDSILFKNWFTEGPNIAALQMSDLSLIAASEMTTLATGILGGTMGDDLLIGTTADDHIEGYAGNDILDGGPGNDLLVGGDGDDNYLFGWNSLGNDVITEAPLSSNHIQLTEGTLLTDLRYTRTNNDLILTLRGGGTTLTLKDYFESQQIWHIHTDNNETIDLADWLTKEKPAIDIAQLQTDFLDAVRAQWVNDLRNNATDTDSGIYTRIDNTTYRAHSVSASEANMVEQRLTLTDVSSDTPIIRRQSDGWNSSITTTDLIQSTTGEASEEQPALEQRFIPISEWYQLTNSQVIPIGVSSINGMYPVYDNDILIGFISDNRASITPDSIQHFWQKNTIIETQIERIQGGDGDNIIEGFKKGNYYQSNNGSGHSDLIRGSEISLIDGGDGNDTLFASGKIRLNDEVFYFADVAPNLGGFLYGNSGDDKLFGNYARDTLTGGSGNDFLDGRFSQDTYVVFAGESGVDTIWDSGTQLWQINNQSDEFIASYLYLSKRPDPLPIAQDTLQLIGIKPEHVTLSSSQRVVEGMRDYWRGTADEFADAMYSQTMHATLIMSWLDGGVEIVLPNSTDLPGMGIERIQFDDGTVFTLSELVTLANFSAATLNPQDLDNHITGSNTNDVIYGEGGHDILDGGDGDDILNGGTGNDVLEGGAGNDTYLFGKDSGHDTINSYDTDNGKIDTVLLDYGIFPEDIRLNRSNEDLILTIISTGDTLSIQNYWRNEGITPYAIEQIKFNETDDVWDLATVKTKLTNTNHAPELLMAIPDQLTNERTIFNFSIDPATFYDPDGDTLTLNATQTDGSPLPAWLNFDPVTRSFSGIPIVSGALGILVTATDSENISISDIFEINVVAQDLVLSGTSAADILNGASGNDTLSGFSGNDILNGYAGDDRLNGGKGIDTMIGGTGNDIYWVDHSEDTVIEQLQEGTDTVRSNISYTLTDNVEHLILIGSNIIFGTGNALDNEITGNSADNVLIGNAGNDKLNGKGGADIMQGGDGDDSYFVDHSSDQVIEEANAGHDTVIATIAYALTDHVENLTLSGAAADTGIGNSENNIITGSKAANILWGRSGNDILLGDGGADTLYGEVGDDTLDGGTGKDTLIGGTGNDTYIFGRGYGRDTIFEEDSTIDVTDQVTFLPDINPDQIWFQHVGNNLEVSIIGTSDKLIIKDWYLDSKHRIDQFKTADDAMLQNHEIESLVAAMAPLTKPGTGQTDLPASYEPILDPLISALWLA